MGTTHDKSRLGFWFRIVIVFASIDGITLSDEKRLIKHLLDNYARVGRVGRPVYNTTETIHVSFGLALIQILDLDEKNQVLTTNCWSRYTWKDILLSWNPDEFGGVSHVRVPTDYIWIPDIVLYNYADDRLREYRDAYAVVNSDGSVLWIPQAIFRSSCAIDITHFPFDLQNCSLKFGSWTYDGFKLDIGFYGDVERVDLNDYVESNEWTIVGHPAAKNIKYYPCCNEPYPDLTFTVLLRRKVAFYNYILILPCVLLSSLTLVLFWLPPESPAKMVLGMNIFVAFFILLLLLAESTPPAASSIPLIGAYYCLNMIMITLSTFLSVIVINLYFRADKRQILPYYMRRVFIDFLSRALCMSSETLPKRHADSQSVVYKDGKDGYKSGRRSQRIKMPDMKYNKFQMLDLSESPPLVASHMSPSPPPPGWMTPPPAATVAPATPRNGLTSERGGDRANGATETATQRTETPTPTHCRYRPTAVERDVRDIRRYLNAMLRYLKDKEDLTMIAVEWRMVALVLDRLFFFMYVTVIIVSLVTIFPKTY